MKKIFFLTLLLFVFGTSNRAYAHGLATTQSKISGEYTLEFEYDTIGSILAGDFTTFSVYLLDKNQNPVHFGKAYLKISKPNGASVLVANLPEAADVAGNARLGGVVPEAGEYGVTLMFDRDGQTIANAEYKFSVGSAHINNSQGGSKAAPYFFGLAGVGIGLILGLSLKRQKKAK